MITPAVLPAVDEAMTSTVVVLVKAAAVVALVGEAAAPQSPHLVVNCIVVGVVHLALIGCCQKILLHLL